MSFRPRRSGNWSRLRPDPGIPPRQRLEQRKLATGAELAADLAARVTLDVHAADQILVYLAQAGGRFIARKLSSHARTAMWLIEQFLPVRFESEAIPDAISVRVVTPMIPIRRPVA